VTHGGEAGEQRCSRVIQNQLQSLVGGASGVHTVIHGILRIAVKVDVGIDQAGQAGEFSQVMDDCLARERRGGTMGLDADNAITPDMDRLIQSRPIRQTVDQTATVDDDVGGLRIGSLLLVIGP
jgi:hypothetical protein